MKRYLQAIGGFSLATLLMVAGANAAAIDFGDGSWNGANGLTSYTVHPSGVNLFASDNVPGVTGVLTAPNGGDGVGVCTLQGIAAAIGGEDCDEVDDYILGGFESLTVTFDSPVALQDFILSNLFTSPPESGGTESGFYSVNGGGLVGFSATSATGALTVPVNLAGVTSLLLIANDDNFSDFTLKGLTTVDPVDAPEPGSLAILGAALAGIGLLRRRRA